MSNLLFWLLLIPYALDLLKSFYSGSSLGETKTLYPRLAIETQRLPFSFFEQRIELIAYRFSLISSLAIVLVWGGFQKTIQFYTERKKDLPYVKTIPAFYFLLLGVLMYEWRNDLAGIVELNYFYSPIWLLKPFGKGFLQTFPYSYYIFLFSVPLHFFKKTQTTASVISFLSFLSCYSIIQSFGKVDHGMIPVLFCTFFYMLFRLKKDNLYIQLIGLSIGFMYFFSGLEKLTAGGLDFVNGSILKSHLLDSEIPNILTHQPFISLISIGVLVFQLGFVFAIPKKKTRIVIIATGLIFHLSITFFMGINDWINPWLLSYLWLIPIIIVPYVKSNKPLPNFSSKNPPSQGKDS